VVAESVPVTITTPEPEPVKASNPNQRRPGRADHAESSIIEVIDLPRVREGSMREARQACLRTGMTVGQYLDAAYEAAPSRPRFKRHADIIRWEAGGHIIVIPVTTLTTEPVTETNTVQVAA